MAQPTLTANLLRQFPFSRYADSGVVKRGRAYHQNGRVTEIDLQDGDVAVVCLVTGDSGDYEVEIRATKSREGASFDCTCPHAEGGNFCKHMVAAALATANFLDELELEDKIQNFEPAPSAPRPALPPAASSSSRKWATQLNKVTQAAATSRAGSRAAPYVAVAILGRSNYYNYGYGYSYAYSGSNANAVYSLSSFIIPAEEWLDRPPEGQGWPGPAEINARLETNRLWIRHGRAPSQALQPAACLNLTTDSVAFLNVLRSLQTAYYGQPISAALPVLLGMLARLDLPVFLANPQAAKVERRLRVWPDPVDVTIDLRQDPSGLTLLAGVERDGDFQLLKGPLHELSYAPCWVLAGDLVLPLNDAGSLAWLKDFPIHVPAAAVETFREEHLPSLAQRLPLRGGLVEWQDIQLDPVPRLYLRDDRRHGLAAELRFAYGAHELAYTKRTPTETVVPVPDTWTLARVHRNAEREAAHFDAAASTAYGLKRGGYPDPDGTLALRSRVHPFDFLLHLVPKLAQAGFEIYGEETLKVGKINRSTPALRVTVNSGIDWFDLKAVVEFGDQHISLQEVRKALQRGERFIKLADGSAGQLPAEWLEKYRHLWGLATETAEGYRVSDAHLPLLDPLLEDDPDLSLPADLQARRERLRQFAGIAAQPTPASFQGELRPYQRHGVDWLNFLNEYKFGGILADDMGLGKTIQVLAFLQLLKERADGAPRAATLLVVPKSLIANWQREAERFTPGLRFLPYVGNVRIKDPAAFAGHDVVLTTYGTMLRDVELLRSYTFHYIVLDESQAVKNPVAKSARAARLLRAEHRLALTGTPVENNSLELWSQFAFLNPGLLGGVDYFRKAFAAPIEAHGDEAAARTLRSLVYPFILRRTKDQVAPELPPRTERVIYADLDPAQKKLYDRTRARYQAELLNLIEREGLNDARFKILEGLLRLRQIAIHPRLVEGRYSGGAPKLDLLIETLETLQAEDHKVLVFSQFVAMLKLVRQALDLRSLKYLYLDGRTLDRQARVDQFQTDPAYPFFLISLKAGGVGLNLTAADYVIHLDPWWNPAVEMQASDRAHRIGQDKPVFIYKLIARDTVEEKILQLQEKKRALVKNLVTTEAAFFKSLTRDDVRGLFG
ncbi:MAG: SNF2 helicase associated domain-containing protein [Anaerolineales bacterium]|nr:SNF2 helicase associated domain-containing protein [Anaerolineales bacterium]